MSGIPKKAFWTYKGRSMSLQSWAVALGVKYSVLRRKLIEWAKRLPEADADECFVYAMMQIESQ